jgi:hypothetical protein
VKEWVRVRAETARVEDDWTWQETLMQSTLDALQERTRQLEARRGELEARTAEERHETADLLARRQELKDAYAQASSHLQALGERLARMRAWLPPRYLVVAYVASHPKDSLAATPLSIAVPADFKQRASAADLDRTLYVTIDPRGRVRRLSAAPDQPVTVDPYIDATVRKFYYEPALKDGKPVESVVQVRLAGLLAAKQ